MNIEDKTYTNGNDSSRTYKNIIPEVIIFNLCASDISFSLFCCFVIFALFSTFIVPPRFPLPPKYTLFIKPGKKKDNDMNNKPKTLSTDLITKIFPIHRSSPQIFKITYLFTKRINKCLCLVSLSLPFSASQVYFSFYFFQKT